MVIANDAGLYEIWISDMDRPRLSRFVHEAGHDCLPNLWTPDAQALIFNCRTTDEQVMSVRRIDSTEEPRVLLSYRLPEVYFPTTFLKDGSTFAVNHLNNGKSEIVLMSLETDEGSPAVGQTWINDAHSAQLSKDGRWLAYLSDVSGRQEVYLRPLQQDGSLGREIPVSTNGGGTVTWIDVASPMQLMYHSRDEVFAVVVNSSDSVSAPKLLGNVTDIESKIVNHTHMSDGRWLVALMGEGEEIPDRVNVVLNWTIELKQRMIAQ